jgi:hypothetical protein
MVDPRSATQRGGPNRYDQVAISKLNSMGLFACKWLRAPATMHDEGLADAG